MNSQKQFSIKVLVDLTAFKMLKQTQFLVEPAYVFVLIYLVMPFSKHKSRITNFGVYLISEL